MEAARRSPKQFNAMLSEFSVAQKGEWPAPVLSCGTIVGMLSPRCKVVLPILFLLSACGKLPGLSGIPAVDPAIPVTGNCKVILAETKDVSGAMCPSGMVARGMVSLGPARIRCSIVDVEC